MTEMADVPFYTTSARSLLYDTTVLALSFKRYSIAAKGESEGSYQVACHMLFKRSPGQRHPSKSAQTRMQHNCRYVRCTNRGLTERRQYTHAVGTRPRISIGSKAGELAAQDVVCSP